MGGACSAGYFVVDNHCCVKLLLHDNTNNIQGLGGNLTIGILGT